MTSTIEMKFYGNVINQLKRSSIPFMVGGGIALAYYTGIQRETRDLDLFCKAGDYPKIISELSKSKYKVSTVDERWLAKINSGKNYIDIIYGTTSGLCPIDDDWFKHSTEIEFFGLKVNIVPPEELLWCKVYIQDRARFDGADINHLILKSGNTIDWKRLLTRLEPHWELLFSCLLNFRFVYPSERNIVPDWIIKELISRLQNQLKIPIPEEKVCRGKLISRYQYQIDTKLWGYADIT